MTLTQLQNTPLLLLEGDLYERLEAVARREYLASPAQLLDWVIRRALDAEAEGRGSER